MIDRNLKVFFKNKKLLILGFGREGESTYRFVRKLLRGVLLGIADCRRSVVDDFENKFGSDTNVVFHTGDNYLKSLQFYDLVIKSPGVSYKKLAGFSKLPEITSQTELFIKYYRDKIIGVTGSKGKSTTSSMIYYIMRQVKKDVVFVGNIGIPPFDRIASVKAHSWIVYELSSHQLENIDVSPHIAVLLNIFQEHLDHYGSYVDYQKAKFNIARYQKSGDRFIFNSSIRLIHKLMEKYPLKSQLFGFGNEPAGKRYCFLSGNDIVCHDGKVFSNIDKHCKLTGRHNLYNMMAVILACRIAGTDDENIIEGISTFTGLPHRLEYIGKYGGVNFYNDSIATIPEAAIEAIQSVPLLATVIIGGYDRGVNYERLIKCLENSSPENFIFIGEAGKRIYDEMCRDNSQILSRLHLIYNFDEAVKLAIRLTPSGRSCLLSPAAASYDMFQNFEERGDRFKELVVKYSKR